MLELPSGSATCAGLPVMATAATASIASRNCKREEAATKLIWLVLRNVQTRWKNPPIFWKAAMVFIEVR